MPLTFNDIVVYPTLFFSLFLNLFFLLTFIEENKPDKPKKPRKFPKISIVIPAYNEGKHILKTIKSCLKVDYPVNKVEIIVVDDESEDKTYGEARKIENKRVRVLRKKHGGKAKAVNYGIEKSKGEIIMVLDADTFPEKDCLKNIVGYFENPKIMAALPSIKIWKPKNFIQKCQAIEYPFMALLKKVFFIMGSMNCTPAGAFIRKSFLEKNGGFSTDTLTEDFEMGLKIQSKNYQIAQSLTSRVQTVVPDNLKKLLRQRIRWSFGTLENIEKYRHMLSPEYGDLGLFFLPLSLFSVGMISLLFIYFTIKLLFDLVHNICLNSLINFDILRIFRFDGKLILNSIITNDKSFIILFSLLAAFTFYEIGRRSVGEKFRMEYAIYFLLYGWVMSISQIIAIAKFIMRKKPKW